MEEESHQALAEGELFGQYRINRILGEGGMGQVYEVEHQVLETHHALKLINPAILEYEESLQYFRNEARVMANLNHPGIVAVDDFGETDGYYWLRLELIPGIQVRKDRVISLDKYLEKREELLHESEVHAFLRQALAAIGYAHTKGVIHCDLKPANILLHPKGAKIADFGIVRLLREDFHRHSAQPIIEETDFNLKDLNECETAIVGTYEYMSPEQRKGLRVDGRSDLYAIGLIAYQMLTGHNLPCLKPASEIRKKIHPAWDQWLQKALEENPADRFRTAQDMLTSLPNVKIPQEIGNDANHHFLQFDDSTHQESQSNQADVPVGGQNQTKRLLFLVLMVVALTIGCAYAFDKWKAFQPVAIEPKGPVPSPPTHSTPDRGSVATISPSPDIRPAPTEPAQESQEPAPKPFEAPIVKPNPSPGFPLALPNAPQIGKAWNVPNLNIKMIWIKGGMFQMGSKENERHRKANEGPQHTVNLSSGFWLARTETTIGQWNELNPGSPLRGNQNLPAHSVSWKEAMQFCNKVQTLARMVPEGYEYRLPTEAEWEYACRAGSQSAYWFGDADTKVSNYVWSATNSDKISHPVGTKPPNQFGLYNMHGNVREWCLDLYAPNYLPKAQTDPFGQEAEQDDGPTILHVSRGGSWRFGEPYCRSAARKGERRATYTSDLGFRISLAPAAPKE